MKKLFNQPRKKITRFLFQEGPSADPFSADDFVGLSETQEKKEVPLEKDGGIMGEKIVDREQAAVDAEAKDRAKTLNDIVKNYGDPAERELVVSALKESLENRTESHDINKDGPEAGLDKNEFESWKETLGLEVEAALFMSDPDHGEFTLMALRQIVDKLQENKGKINWSVFNARDFKVSQGTLCIQKRTEGDLTLFSLDDVGSLENSAGVKIADKEQQEDFLDSLESSLDEHVAALEFCTNNKVNFPDPKKEVKAPPTEAPKPTETKAPSQTEALEPTGPPANENDGDTKKGDGGEVVKNDEEKEGGKVAEEVAEKLQQERQDNIDTAYNIPGKDFLKKLEAKELAEMGIKEADFGKKIQSPIAGKDFKVLESIVKYQEFINKQHEVILLAEDGLKGPKTDVTLEQWRARQEEVTTTGLQGGVDILDMEIPKNSLSSAQKIEHKADTNDIEKQGTPFQKASAGPVNDELISGPFIGDLDVKDKPKTNNDGAKETEKASPEAQAYFIARDTLPKQLLDDRLVNRAKRQAEKGNFEKASDLLARLEKRNPEEFSADAEAKAEKKRTEAVNYLTKIDSFEELLPGKLEINPGYDKESASSLNFMNDHEIDPEFSLGLAHDFKDFKEAQGKILTLRADLNKEIQKGDPNSSSVRSLERDIARGEASQGRAAVHLLFRKTTEENFRKGVKAGTYSGTYMLNNQLFVTKRASDVSEKDLANNKTNKANKYDAMKGV